MKYLFLLLSFVLLFIASVSKIKAQVVINEFSSGSTSDWIELYNVSTESADLSIYKLMDSGTNDKVLSGIVSPNGFVSFSFSNWLNNGGDTVRLFNNNIQVDSISYGGTDQVCAAEAGQSIGRYPDANSTIERFSAPTENASNNSAILNPCPTPTPEPTATPTSAPTPTPNPTNTPSPTAAPTKTPTPVPTKTPTLKPSIFSSPTATSEELVLGIQDATSTPDVLSEDEVETQKKFPVFPVILIVAGFLLIAGGIFFFIKNNVKKTA